MSALEDLLKGGNVVTALGISIGAAVVAPVIRPVLRPLAKSLLKAGLIGYDQGRAALADLSRETSNFVGEVRSELAGGEHATEAEGSEGHPPQASGAVGEGPSTQRSRSATRRSGRNPRSKVTR